MSLQFDKRFFTEEIRGNIDHPHFLQRAKWIANYIKPESIVYILGCGFGYLVKHLRNLDINVIGIEISDYAYEHRKNDSVILADIVDIDYSNADYLFSWNMLDCLNEKKAIEIANHLNKFSAQQIHIISTDKRFIEQGYFIKPMNYWQELFPKVFLVEYETEKIYGIDSLKIPLSGNKVSE